MAKFQNTSVNSNSTFEKNLNKDIKDFHLPKGAWTHARNAIKNSISGDLGDIGNEPSNILCVSAPYTIIGYVHLYADRFAVFSTDNINSEIGIFQEERCLYTRVANDPCLAFNTSYLIKGESKQNFDCSWQVYWDDGINPSRSMNMDSPPYIQNCVTVDDCITCTDTDQLDCDKIRLARLVTNPCIRVQRGATGGELLNGSYFAVIAYTINQQRVTDYSVPSNIQSIFEHENVAGSLDIFIDEIDTDYEEFELVIVSTINQQTSARRVGIYSTRQSQITLDSIKDQWITVPIEFIPIRSQIFDRSDGMFRNGDYLIRVGPYTKFDFNYQPFANQIVAKWVSVEYPADYYRKGGNKTGHMRDEVYPFFIRFVYDTGDKTPSFHIPGRAAQNFTLPGGGPVLSELAPAPVTNDAIEYAQGFVPAVFEVFNTATITSLASSTLPDGGIQIAEGLMGYWESTEHYPDNKPQIWDSSSQPWSGTTNPNFDLCGKAIRHHKFPDNALHPTTHHFNPLASTIRIMGVKFENINAPVDNLGVPIPGIVGYEILRGSREGNKTVIAKGIINNMGEYDIEDSISPRTGLYPNYPYNDLNPDKFISTTETHFAAATCSVTGYNPNPIFSRKHFTLHSPDTQFKNPFLSAKEIKIYGELNGIVEGQYIEPENHPKHKIVTDLAFYVSLVSGVGVAMIAMNGTRKTTKLGPRMINLSGLIAGASSGTIPIDLGVTGIGAMAGWSAGYGGITSAFYDAGALLLGNVAGLSTDPYYGALSAVGLPLNAAMGMQGYTTNVEQEDGKHASIPLLLRVLNAIPTFSYYLSEGTENVLRIIRNIVPYRQYALQYQSHCKYDVFVGPQLGNNRRLIDDAIYIDPQIQDFGTAHRINNLFRGRAVSLNTTNAIGDPIFNDNSRQRVGDLPGLVNYDNPTRKFNTRSSCHYVGMKQRMRNQYGQLDGIIQVPTTTCMIDLSNINTPVLFNGDTYVSRYTEKNTMFFFYDWLDGQPNGFEFDYLMRKNIPHPAYWMNTQEFDLTDFVQSIASNLLSPASWVTPSDYHVLDRAGCPVAFGVKKAFMYLFNSGVRDFFVESEVNTDFRDWGEKDSERYYDDYRYTDLKRLFHTGIIRSGNFFKYDYSLSISRLYNNFISWGNVQDRSYDPDIAQTCFSHYPKRAIYSLPQNLELKKDNWYVFLVNNYKDFSSRIIAIKTIGESGAMMFFENESPLQIVSSDVLETSAGAKVVIGDGGLFNQPVYNIVNVDDPIEYGSCQNRLAIANTPAGLFYISQNQGKIFRFSGGLKEISNTDLKWWFAMYLPYFLTEDFPDYDFKDNPVSGIGCQVVYDNKNSLVYFTKRDFKLRKDLNVTITYEGDNVFLLNKALRVELGDPNYFIDASWTASYDPKGEGEWGSWHDWHPNLVIPSKRTFLSTKGSGIWIHNLICNSYCNFYGIDYPFEIEITIPNGKQVMSLRSVEYILEVYRYDENCYDRFHQLEQNFDEAVIFNTEQCSGLLRLNLSPKNDIPALLQYPIINANNIEILFSKEENKYRFNQFWDITDNRGEFSTAQRMIWNTAPNGYVKTLNPVNLNYAKFALERKKFRHYTQTVFLRKRVSGSSKFLFMISETKNLISQR